MATVYGFFKTHVALMRVQTWVVLLASMPGLFVIVGAVICWGNLSTAYGIVAATAFLYGSRPFLVGYMAVQVSMSNFFECMFIISCLSPCPPHAWGQNLDFFVHIYLTALLMLYLLVPY